MIYAIKINKDNHRDFFETEDKTISLKRISVVNCDDGNLAVNKNGLLVNKRYKKISGKLSYKMIDPYHHEVKLL